MTTRTETADLLRSILELVRAGDLEAPGQTGSQLVARVEGAIAGLEASSPRTRARSERKRGTK